MRLLAVVIVSWNVSELLSRCLRSLLNDLSSSGIEGDIQVVDNASTDGTPEQVAEHFPDVGLITNRDNLGFAVAINQALRPITSPRPPSHRYAWLLNPDTEVLPGATEALLECLESGPRIGVVGAKLLFADGSLQHSAFRFPGLIQLGFELLPLPARLYDTPINGRYPTRLYEQMAPFPVDHPLGASMMVRSEAVAQVGLMDEEYHMYCEEIDWSWRMRHAGWQAYCVPAAEVIHHAGRSSSQVPLASFVNLWTSRARLYSRFRGPVARRLAHLMVRTAMGRRLRSISPEVHAAREDVLGAWREPP